MVVLFICLITLSSLSKHKANIFTGHVTLYVRSADVCMQKVFHDTFAICLHTDASGKPPRESVRTVQPYLRGFAQF